MGYSEGWVFPPQVLPDAFVRKISPDGIQLWLKNLSSETTGSVEPRFIDMDTQGRLIALCNLTAVTDTSQSMLIVVCLDPDDGREIWRTHIPGEFLCVNLRAYPDRIQYFVSEYIGNKQYYHIGHLDYDGKVVAQYRKPYVGWYLDYNYLTDEGNVLLGNLSGGHHVAKLSPLGDTIWA